MSGGDSPGHVIDVQLLGLNDTYIATWSPPSLPREKEGKNLSLAAACVRVCVVGPQHGTPVLTRLIRIPCSQSSTHPSFRHKSYSLSA